MSTTANTLQTLVRFVCLLSFFCTVENKIREHIEARSDLADACAVII